ncbi:hypothetical protein PENCOP_c005G01161 [Penicillium coprophilum]|uniref:BZIP domain-containing protein n=1 Tax=Penicillium coprophilum TaxID=36646 RepID=A0A1V6URF2_9EURO|nr:hypothetical protein PENCOP_c005G01161 [Penicillium coprophilum]
MTSQDHQSPTFEQTNSDDSTEVLDPAARRRLQNRLNQRASRKRKASEARNQHRALDKKWVVYIEDSKIPKKNAFTNEAPSNQIARLPSSPRRNGQYLYRFNSPQRDELINNGRARTLHMIENPVLSLNPTLHTCVIRAMLVNASLMGLTIELLEEDLASQFNLVGPSTLHLPPSLYPSQKQRKIIHHPWIDLIPMLSLREALLARTDEIDEDEICCDFYQARDSSQEVGLRVWGEAWDPSAYEASETLIRKWSWIPKDCPDIIESSNYWRIQRGEKPMTLERIK